MGERARAWGARKGATSGRPAGGSEGRLWAGGLLQRAGRAEQTELAADIMALIMEPDGPNRKNQSGEGGTGAALGRQLAAAAQKSESERASEPGEGEGEGEVT